MNLNNQVRIICPEIQNCNEVVFYELETPRPDQAWAEVLKSLKFEK